MPADARADSQDAWIFRTPVVFAAVRPSDTELGRALVATTRLALPPSGLQDRASRAFVLGAADAWIFARHAPVRFAAPPVAGTSLSPRARVPLADCVA